MTKLKPSKGSAVEIVVCLITLTLCLLAGFYFNSRFIVDDVHYLRIFVYIAPPLIVARYLGIPMSLFYGAFRMPKFNRQTLTLMALGLAVALGILAIVPKMSDYLHFYSKYRAPEIPIESRWLSFLLFTVSTLPPWEFLHRGFALLGIGWLFEKRLYLQKRDSEILCIGLVLMSESLYHLVKPAPEAFGMVLFSPLLSLLTLRASSLWPAMFLHLSIEAAFILSVSSPSFFSN